LTSKIEFIEVKRFFCTATLHPMNKLINIHKRPFLKAALKFSALWMLFNVQAGEASSVQTHSFNVKDCGFTLTVNVAIWERQTRLRDAYVASKTKISADQERVYIQAIVGRKSQLEDPAANLFDAQQCAAKDIGKEATASGLRIRLQAAECSQQASSDDSRSLTGQHRLYGTVDGHWSALGVGLFASNKNDLAKFKPEFVQILKTLRHQCPIEFLPLKTGAAAELAHQKAVDIAIKKAAGAAQKAAENAAKMAAENPSTIDSRPRQSVRRTVPLELEWRMAIGNQCDFAFQTVQSKWGPDTFEGTEGLIPIGSKSKSKIFLTADSYWIAQGDNGAWSATTDKNCTVKKRGTLKTADGHEAPIFLASNCKKSADFSPNLNKSNLLYSYVRRSENGADYLVLASDDKSFLMRHEDELMAIIESYTTRLPKCLSYRK
jgi:hypothetical protein